MNLRLKRKEKLGEICAHEWMVEPAWRLISLGQCQKCQLVKHFRNNQDLEEPARKRRILWWR